MTWKPHWCEEAQKIAAENGWTVHEIEGGVMVLRSEDGTDVTVDLTGANALALSADNAADEAIAKAVAAMPTKATADRG